MNLEIKTQEKGKIIKSSKRKMALPKEMDNCPFPEAKIGDLLHFTMRNELSSSVPKYEFITDIFEHSLKTERINPKELRVEIMKYHFDLYLYPIGDFYENSKPIEIIKDTLEYQRIESNMKNLGVIL